jgi:uncharacterized protein YggU (UPF0235/DUF167 family)
VTIEKSICAEGEARPSRVKVVQGELYREKQMRVKKKKKSAGNSYEILYVPIKKWV